MKPEEAILKAILTVQGRIAFPSEKLLEIVSPNGPGTKQLMAFNLCDGTRIQSDIASEVGLDRGNFSRTVTRWVEEGVAFRIGEGTEARPLHIYALPKSMEKNK